ncbi:S-adenosylmethionine decarboxylase [Patescibacteria group bacterium]|nr:S-adenosylmethionine decarboxylase [Patescibacteria group bacterium]
MKPYGKELILDLHHCDSGRFTRKNIRNYFRKLCELIDMERCKLSWWDDYGLPTEECQTEPHLKGTSAIQFILTSNITIHTLDLLNNAYINIFSCKDFDADAAMKFSADWFKGEIVNSHLIERK